MRRSVENAEHVGQYEIHVAHPIQLADRQVGLYAPRAGQHYRDEQRRRRSQYDRGTRLAALEEFEFEEVTSYQDGRRFLCKILQPIFWKIC